MRQSWKSSTALIATISLAFPAPMVAQTNQAAVPEFLCFDGSDLPCADGVKKVPTAQMICEDGAPLPCADGVFAVPKTAMVCENGESLPCGEGVAATLRPEMAEQLQAMRQNAAAAASAEDVAEEQPEVEEAPQDSAQTPPVEAEAEAQAEGAASDTPDAAPTEEPPAEPAEAPAEAPVQQPEEALEETPAEAPDEQPAEVPEEQPAETPEEAPTEVPNEAPSEAPAGAPAEVPEETPAEAPADVPTEAPTEAPAETQTEVPAEPQPVPADPVTPSESESDQTEGAEVPADEAFVEEEQSAAPAETPAPAPAPTDVTPEDATTEDEAALAEALEKAGDETQGAAEGEAEQAEAPVPDLPVQPEAESGEAPATAAADAPADGDAVAEITEEVVTEETARSSDEDFANKVGETATPADSKKAKPEAAAKDKGGLSKGETAMLLGLGAVAVGAILSNNREVALNSGDRVVVTRDDGSFEVIKDDNALLRQPGSKLRTETFGDGSTRTTITREDGSQIVTIRDAEYRVLRRVHVAKDGTQTYLIDDTVDVEPVDVASLPAPAPRPDLSADADEEALRKALAQEAAFERRFSLAQIRNIAEVRALVPVIDLDAITFETGSAAIRPDQAKSLSRLGKLIQRYVEEDRNEVFLIEGHTDAVGSAAYNLALSDRRAESVALALTEYFDVPPENLVVQGYGEGFLKVQTEGDERANRRASVRRITQLLRQAAN
ncbi:OmpA family protein [Aliiroseovarius sediminis]|uniref:OmpA family protein n=1 Tax=Aliiroseovarius sediminis TaxID=2925839 RepID=UPI001F594B90|nr:OmpA family protein [Aliiroseovarius sediminis]MCI2395155.1 OmpA family protein [Aliiroseovarius sediminis]